MSEKTKQEQLPERPDALIELPNKAKFTELDQIATDAMELSAKASEGFERAYVTAAAIQRLKKALDGDVMRPIMALQGSPLGFVTDRDWQNGYTENEVKECLITGVLMGLRPYGNEMNIIAGRTYAALAGVERNANALCDWIEHNPSVPEWDTELDRAIVLYRLRYKPRGSEPKEKELSISVRLQRTKDKKGIVTTDDAILGKARRKALFALWRELSGRSDINEGDAADLGALKNVTPKAGDADLGGFGEEEK